MGVDPRIFALARNALKQATRDEDHVEVEKDQEEESESLASSLQFNEEALAGLALDSDEQELSGAIATETKDPDEPASKKQRVTIDQFKANFDRASGSYIVEGTRREYERQWEQFLTFCANIGFVESVEELRSTFEAGDVPTDTPTWIALWIMKKCDKIDLETGEERQLEARPGYGTAQKMRAAMSHKFGRDYNRGDQAWAVNPLRSGSYAGNPSLSATVSRYMVSLRRRKVHDGEVVTSACAMDEHVLKRLYEHNMDRTKYPPDHKEDKPRKRGDAESWNAGASFRIMLILMYILSFLCLLRFDEVLGIEWSHIKLDKLDDGTYRLIVTLPFRKTHQTGVSAYCALVEIIKNQFQTGFIFRKKVGGKFSMQPKDAMSPDSFLDSFRNNLLDIGEDPRPFGTHSFRRGGCQHLAVTLRWPLRDVCTWGGWSENFDNPGTIFKYLLSFADTPTVPREDYFNPNRAKGEHCAFCNRSCRCS
ncbi:hypothetical protein EIP86_007667 [Pleurotus ostreatoroseus]|nr:hypothetical protein EIP86_007667 [Pleurotus ostreatoroseus]